MIGKYIISQDGKVLAEVPNVLTWAGKQTIIKYLAGLISEYAGAIAVGVGSTAANVNDNTLEFEVGRAPVNMKAVKTFGTQVTATPSYNQNAQVVFRGTMSEDVAGEVYEVG